LWIILDNQHPWAFIIKQMKSMKRTLSQKQQGSYLLQAYSIINIFSSE
ncbi:hypothetical protein HMPREF0083_04335, partial [Aneurinibacillus aneurinilyticus ATCC 12856]